MKRGVFEALSWYPIASFVTGLTRVFSFAPPPTDSSSAARYATTPPALSRERSRAVVLVVRDSSASHRAGRPPGSPEKGVVLPAPTVLEARPGSDRHPKNRGEPSEIQLSFQPTGHIAAVELEPAVAPEEVIEDVCRVARISQSLMPRTAVADDPKATKMECELEAKQSSSD